MIQYAFSQSQQLHFLQLFLKQIFAVVAAHVFTFAVVIVAVHGIDRMYYLWRAMVVQFSVELFCHPALRVRGLPPNESIRVCSQFDDDSLNAYDLTRAILAALRRNRAIVAN